MKILELRVLSGPNFWSVNRKKLIAIKLDIGKYEYLPTNKLKDFGTRLKKLLPSLHEHRCSEGVEGGFFLRVKDGTWIGHVIEHIALELQWLTGMPCGFGRTFGTRDEGIYHVILAFQIESAGIYALKAAISIAETLAEGKDYENLEADLNELKRICKEESFGPSTQALIAEATARNIPYFSHSRSLLTFGYGVKQKKLWASLSSSSSAIGVDLVCDKELTKKILAEHFMPVPKGHTIKSLEELDKAIVELGLPLVVKPLDGNHGRGVSTNITTAERAILAFNIAKKISETVIVEQHIQGQDFRFLVVNSKVVAVAKRLPAAIVGTGRHTIKELIDIENSASTRGDDHENILTKIVVDEGSFTILAEANLSESSVLEEGRVFYLKDAANLSSGGTAIDVTEEVHPANLLLAEKIAKIVDLDICGIDIVAQDITSPISQGNGAIIEVNASPGLRMHLAPSKGKARNVAKPILEMLFPNDEDARIPVVAVTGTNGKTTVVRLIAHLASKMDYKVGFTSTDGIYINNKLIYKGDCSGPKSAQAVLRDPEVEFAVVECARGGILREGLGFSNCDISIITNISSDHLGLDDIHSLEDLAAVKGVVARSTRKEGYAILNAEDEFVYNLRTELSCSVAFFGMHKNQHIKEHIEKGGLAAYVENGHIFVAKNKEIYDLLDIKSIPLSFNATAPAMIQNLLPVVLAGIISNFPMYNIKQALLNFLPTPTSLPGRMNTFEFDNCKVLIDYAHNEGAFIELNKYLGSVDGYKMGVIAAPGDRRDTDIEKLGYLAANMFDEIIIRHDKDSRGRENTELTELLLKGIKANENKPIVSVISDEFEALSYAIQKAETNTYIFHTPEIVLPVLEFMKDKANLKQTI